MDQNQFSRPILTRNSKDTLELTKDSTSVQELALDQVVTSTSKEADHIIIPISSADVNYQTTAWFIGVLLLVLMLISKIKLTFPRLTPIVLHSLYRNSEATKLQKSRNSRNKACYLLMNILFVIVFSVFLFEVSVYYGIILRPTFSSFAYIILYLLTFGLFKIIMVKTLGYIFKSSPSSAEYSFNLLLVCKTVGMILIPFIIALPFINYSAVNTMNIIAIVLVSIAYVLIIFRGLRIIFLKHISILYMILYLCALEIMPFIIISKLVLSK